MSMQPAQWIPLLFLIPVVALIVWRNFKPRRLRVEVMWVRPAMIIVMALFVLYNSPPRGPLMIAICLAALAAGAGLGFLRGRMMRISVDPETHLANVQGSPLAVLFIIAIVAVRYGVETFMLNGSLGAGGSNHGQLTQISDALILFVVGLIGVQSAEMWIRARRLVTESRTAKATAQIVT